MAELTPYPFGRLVSRMLREVEEGGEVFGLPRRSFFRGAPGKDLSVRLHGRPASTPLGPAAGPHTQLAQNMALAWLGGARVFELKTVQVLDRLKIPRPCIDMRNVGYNVEWSQELSLEQSLEEYVKASMLADILREAGLAPGADASVFDMSVGYDLKGIQSPRVRAFIKGMKDAGPVVDRLRREIPAELSRWRDLDFRTSVSGSVTVSAFHGCPPGEIEAIAGFLVEEEGLDVVLKLNPTLLGPSELRRLLHEELGYAELSVPDWAFEKDPSWEDACGFIERLDKRARGLGRGFGVKFSNTLVVLNRGGFLPAAEETSYLSGPPLHVLAIRLVRKARERFGAGLPVSFSGGIDRMNFPDALSLGLAPVTVCSDLLKPGGLGRLSGYLQELRRRMDAAGASDIPGFIMALGGGKTLEQAILKNTEAYVRAAAREPRYAKAGNAALPRKTGGRLGLFDCLACDKCLSACPNNANFAYPSEGARLPRARLVREGKGWRLAPEEGVPLARGRQIAHFADFCNQCGNCDVFCPEAGAPYLKKPRFFGSLAAWRRSNLDGFFLSRDNGIQTVRGRIAGRLYELDVSGPGARCSGDGLSLVFSGPGISGTARGEAPEGADLSPYLLMDFLRQAVLTSSRVNYVNS